MRNPPVMIKVNRKIGINIPPLWRIINRKVEKKNSVVIAMTMDNVKSFSVSFKLWVLSTVFCPYMQALIPINPSILQTIIKNLFPSFLFTFITSCTPLTPSLMDTISSGKHQGGGIYNSNSYFLMCVRKVVFSDLTHPWRLRRKSSKYGKVGARYRAEGQKKGQPALMSCPTYALFIN